MTGIKEKIELALNDRLCNDSHDRYEGCSTCERELKGLITELWQREKNSIAMQIAAAAGEAAISSAIGVPKPPVNKLIADEVVNCALNMFLNASCDPKCGQADAMKLALQAALNLLGYTQKPDKQTFEEWLERQAPCGNVDALTENEIGFMFKEWMKK